MTRLASPPMRPLVWPATLALASTRIVLLAHYPTDVAAGLTFGVILDRAVNALLRGLRGIGGRQRARVRDY